MSSVPDKEYLLTASCSVCGHPAAPHLHYGAISCYSCRAFFRRGRPKQLRCFFGHGQCKISRQNRTNCKLCRYRKCSDVGMKPHKVDFYLNKRKQKEAQEANNEKSPECCDKEQAPTYHKSAFKSFESAMNQSINESINKNTKTLKESVIYDKEDHQAIVNSSPHTYYVSPFQNNMSGTMKQCNEPFSSAYCYTQSPYIYHNEVTMLENPRICRGKFDGKYKDLKQGSNAVWDELGRSIDSLNNPLDVPDSSNQTSVIRYLNSTGTIYTKEKSQQFIEETTNNQIVEKGKTKREVVYPNESYYRSEDSETSRQEPSYLEQDKQLQITHFEKSINKNSYYDYQNLKESNVSKLTDSKTRLDNTYFAPYDSSREKTNVKYGQFQKVEKRKSVCDTEIHSYYTKVINEYFDEILSKDVETTITEKLADKSDYFNHHSKAKREEDDTKKNYKRKYSFSSDSEDESNPVVSKEVQSTPLKKRPRMLEIPYATGHAVNKQVLPVMSFTFEEEFQVVDYIVRIQQYQNKRFEFVCTKFQHYKELTAAFVACTSIERKIPFNRHLEKQLFSIGLEFTKQSCQNIYEEMRILSSEVRREVLNITYPALYVVMWAILEGNTKENTWIEQHRKTLHITKENHAALKDYIRGLENVRSISLKDQERFTSPWAVEMEDEEKFERTVSLVGRLLQGDLQLQALYHMFVMMSCSNKAPERIQTDPALCNIQVKLSQLMYRYLSTKSYFNDTVSGDITEETDEKVVRNGSQDTEDIDPDEKTRLLISLVDDLHDCVDIMQNRSLLV